MDRTWLLLLFLHAISVVIAVDSGKMIVYNVETTGERLVRAQLSKDNISGVWTMDRCLLFGYRPLITDLLNFEKDKYQIQRLKPSEMTALIDNCLVIQNATSYTFDELLAPFKGVPGHALFPGTKWCGPGNVSNTGYDLGPVVAADACCRDQNYCDDITRGYTTKHGLYNAGKTTILDCDCEAKFSNCLKRVNTTTANTIGYVYFNLGAPTCYNFTYPIKKCLSYFECRVPAYNFSSKRCQEYELDESKPMIWQHFDNKFFSNPFTEPCM